MYFIAYLAYNVVQFPSSHLKPKNTQLVRVHYGNYWMKVETWNSLQVSGTSLSSIVHYTCSDCRLLYWSCLFRLFLSVG